MFYPGALTLLPLRAFISLGSFAFACLLLQPVMIGFNPNVPWTGFRDRLRSLIIHYSQRLIVLMAFMSLEVEYVDIDYSYYLGKDYKEK